MKFKVLVHGRKYEVETSGMDLVSVYDPSVDHEADLSRLPFGIAWKAVFPMGAELRVSLNPGIGYKFKHGESSDWRVEYPTIKSALAYCEATDNLSI